MTSKGLSLKKIKQTFLEDDSLNLRKMQISRVNNSRILRSRIWDFQGIVFTWTCTYSEIFKSAEGATGGVMYKKVF